MGRFDTQFHRPPVRLAGAMAADQNAIMLRGAEVVSDGADRFGGREARFGSVPIRLRIDKGENALNEQRIGATIPINHTHRKAGYPPIPTSLEGVG